MINKYGLVSLVLFLLSHVSFAAEVSAKNADEFSSYQDKTLIHQKLSKQMDPQYKPNENQKIEVTVTNTAPIGFGRIIGLGRVFGDVPISPAWGAANSYNMKAVPGGKSVNYDLYRYGSTGDFKHVSSLWLLGCGVGYDVPIIIDGVTTEIRKTQACSAALNDQIYLPENIKKIEFVLGRKHTLISDVAINEVQITTYKS
ncbi:hypothetical protein [Cysteiniphilum sp. QT6929]|uniref:hypothetical protein n=1 Tax=Cysteiniphilum sp. QT6929 TaxID=2975055 RepID=UPI0024B35F31|nr:hypothetical protein [Cysteiniphilum sp. QT6929]WHN65119.1 hypothetical protein NYP54_08715 [Cysteiniphilum sp. QT6929]